ncbi:PPOX class F420-dependent oxidoreductase [Isoptericola croceus]|uniref:PPOX class F420-dependent oxidoreductase n=1 Tax=Isoptericola croceus TaxID=3031406 RepID=UPI0023FA4153|nr:PPOX class F420-dependent oxidoreductase [Isoptericola croceus]
MFTDVELAYLASQRLGRIATQKPDGTLQNSPVGFRYHPSTRTVDVTGHELERSRKFRNVADNGRVALVVDDLASTSPWRPRCVEIRGHAEAVPGDGTHPPVIRIHPERIISFGLTDTAARSSAADARDVG